MKTNIGGSYSQVIRPENYNQIVSNEHIYISSADQFLVKRIKELAVPLAEVVELGCGPARVLPLVRGIEKIKLTGLDIDSDFLDYARRIMKKEDICITAADIEIYQHDKEVDIFYSHGLHHHVSKGDKTINYLNNVWNNLKKGGYYILIDEFIPSYDNTQERELRVVVWYSHVIASAIKRNYNYLAQEESKIFLDDLYEGRANDNIKSQEQINLVLSRVEPIDQAARTGDLDKAQELSKEFLSELERYHNLEKHGDLTIDLSRGDYKICESILRKEIEKTRFSIESVKHFGPIETIGAISVYSLKKGW